MAAADDMDELVQAVKQAIQQCCLQVCLLPAHACFSLSHMMHMLLGKLRCLAVAGRLTLVSQLLSHGTAAHSPGQSCLCHAECRASLHQLRISSCLQVVGREQTGLVPLTGAAASQAAD